MTEKKLGLAWYWFARNLCKLFVMTFFKVRFYNSEYVPTEGPLLLVSNHQSFLDPIFCGGIITRHIHFFARDTLFKNPLVGPIITSVGTIPVKRGQADLSAVRAVIAKLKNGCGVCLFPEATRTKDGKIAPFKPGLGLLCRRGKAKIVPVVIDGAFECWPRHKKLFSPGSKIAVSYGQPISAEQIKEMTDKQLAEKLTNTLREMQKKIREMQNKKPIDY